MSSFRLSIWRPFHSDRKLHYAPGTIAENAPAFDRSNLFEEIYSWTPEIGILDGVNDENIREEIRKRMFEDFSENIASGNRNFAKLNGLLQLLGNLAARQDSAGWTNSSQSVGEASLSFRCVPATAFYHHLVWLKDVYGEMPELSILIQ